MLGYQVFSFNNFLRPHSNRRSRGLIEIQPHHPHALNIECVYQDVMGSVPHLPGVPLSLTDVVLTTVQPLEKTAHVETIDPTFMDLFCTNAYIPTFFAYRLSNNSDAAYSELVKGIKDSLQKVLGLFFSFAGRWIAVPSGLRLMCNDAGVPFIEANLDADLDSVVKASTAFQPVSELQGYGVLGLDFTVAKQQVPPQGLPAFFVQITRFKCGGVVLAATFNHLTSDAKGFINFMTAWSDLSRTDETAVRVDHRRAQAENASLRALIPDTANIKLAEDITASANDPVSIKGYSNGDGAVATLPARKLVDWGMRAFEVGASTIQSLKQEAKNSDKNGLAGYISTADCIVAQLSRSIAAIPPSLRRGREAAVSVAVEGRTRFYDPPLSDLCGNVLSIFFPPEVPNNELAKMPLISIARRLRTTLETTRREEWTGSEKWEKVLEVFGSDKFSFMPITSWLNFPMYEVDFGFGKPHFVVCLNLLYACTSGLGLACIAPPNPNNSSSRTTVYVWSSPDVLLALERDPEFRSFFADH